MSTNPFLKSTSTSTSATPADVSHLFAGPNDNPRTEHHGFELPKELREYRPKYARGRYVLPDVQGTAPDGLKATRVTTGVKALDDTTGLQRWQLRETVHGLKRDPELLDDIDEFADPRDINRDIDRVVERAQVEAGTKRASELGTAVHAWLEAVEGGHITADDVPDQFRPYIDAYLARLAEHGVSTPPGMIERIVFDEQTGWAGTFDRVYRLNDGVQVIGDVKTSKVSSFRYGILSFSQQLAVYARASHMLAEDGQSWERMPEVSQDFGVIAHVPSNEPGRCDLHTVDLQFGRDAVDLAEAVRNMRSRAGGTADTYKVPTLVDAINRCQSLDDLAAVWEEYADVWTDELTLYGKKHAATL